MSKIMIINSGILSGLMKTELEIFILQKKMKLEFLLIRIFNQKGMEVKQLNNLWKKMVRKDI